MIQEADEKTIRKYLLGDLAEEQQVRLEERLMTENEYFKLLEVIEDELIDDSVSSQLTSEEQVRFDTYFLSTPERRERFIFAQALREYVSRTAAEAGEAATVPGPARWRQPLSNPYLRAVAAAIILLAIGLGTYRIFFRQSEVSKGMAALAKAYREQPPLEERITGLDYPPLSITRGSEQGKVDYVARDRAERILFDEAEEHPSAASYHALGRLYLVKHEYEKAVEQFDKALKLDEKNAQVESDYGVALMGMGKAARSSDESGKSLEEFAQSFEHLSRALELNGSLLEALFNRALCCQYLSLPQQAEEDWRQYLEKDPRSKWADEAREHLKQLEDQKQKTAQNKEQLYQDFLSANETRDDERAWKAFGESRFRSGNFILERLLDNYLGAATGGRANEAGKYLQALLYAGGLENQKTGDQFTSDLARFYSLTSPAELSLLAQAHQLMKSAQDEDNQSRLDQAIQLYAKAGKLIEMAGSDCEARYIEYRMSLCYLRKPDISASLSILEPLLAGCGDKKHLWLQARIFNGLSHAHESLNEYSKALDYSRQSLDLSQRIGDMKGVVRSLIQMASEYQSIGDYTKSLSFLHRGLVMANASSPDIAQVWVIYDVAAQNFASLNLYAAAIHYQKETLRLADQMGVPLNLSRGYSHLGLIYGKFNNYDEAIKNEQRSFEIGESLSDESIGLDMMAHSALHLGHLHKQAGDFNKALAYYDQTIELYDKVNFNAESYEAHKGKLLCYVALQDDQSAARELRIALNFIEQYRYKILEESSRNAFFDNEQEIYDLAIDFEYTKMNNPQVAFEYAEASRARSLLDLYSPTARVLKQSYGPDLLLTSVLQPLKLAQLQERLPDQAQILQYAVLSDKIIIWVVSKTKFSSAQAATGLHELNEKITAYLRTVTKATGEETLDLSKQVYDILLKPVEPFLDKRKYLCIIPDKSLNYVPFAALASPATGNYFISDFLFGFAPSSTIFLNCTDIARAKSAQSTEKILSVGNPSFDRAEFPSLYALSSSGREAQTAASFYNSSFCVVEANAREALVKSEMQEADVIHLATHFVTDERSPMLSALLLTKEDSASNQDLQTDGKLQAYEICDLKLPRARLVILSACQTGIERVYRGEGAIGIVRPFIKAGVPLIVASLWPVNSDSTSELMIGFHRYRKREGKTTAEALRLAQLEMLKSPDERLRKPFYWASFIPIGGYTTF